MRLVYASIPLSNGSQTWPEHPQVLIPISKLSPSSLVTYEIRLQGLRGHLGITGCDFEGSLSAPRATPVLENLEDWIEGVRGTTVALPYYIKTEKAEPNQKTKKKEDTR